MCVSVETPKILTVAKNYLKIYKLAENNQSFFFFFSAFTVTERHLLLNIVHKPLYYYFFLSKTFEGICLVSGLSRTATCCLCFDMLVHKPVSSKTTVDLNRAKGMLLLFGAGAQRRRWEKHRPSELLLNCKQLFVFLCGHQLEMYSLHLFLTVECFYNPKFNIKFIEYRFVCCLNSERILCPFYIDFNFQLEKCFQTCKN